MDFDSQSAVNSYSYKTAYFHGHCRTSKKQELIIKSVNVCAWECARACMLVCVFVRVCMFVCVSNLRWFADGGKLSQSSQLLLAGHDEGRVIGCYRLVWLANADREAVTNSLAFTYRAPPCRAAWTRLHSSATGESASLPSCCSLLPFWGKLTT